MEVRELDFKSQGLTCSARLFLPNASKPPVVVMAHGFAAEQDFRLPAFAEKFAAKGMAVMTFDYRNFGKSEGKPRNLVHPGRHVEDWLCAIEFVRGLEQVDGSRLGLWGSSFSGGHVLVAAAKVGDVRAIVSQVPFVDAISVAANLSPRYTLAGLYHAIVDVMVSVFGGVHYVPVVADPDEFGLMNTPESKPGYLALVPEGSDWKNQAPARVALTMARYRPVTYAGKIKCPVLMICAENDSLIPPDSVKKCADKIENCRLENLPVGHFDVYVGEWFEKVADVEAEFLAGVLL